MTDTPAKIMTVTGVEFDLVNVNGSDFRLVDGAAAISRICRFGGHISEEFADDIYSVAQHSCYVFDLLQMFGQRRSAFWGLMHDFPEGYYGDTITPLKNLFPELARMEDVAATFLRMQWGIPFDGSVDEQVHWADRLLGCAEAFRLKERGQAQAMYGCDGPPITLNNIDPNFHCWSPLTARKQFIARYHRAKKEAMEQSK